MAASIKREVFVPGNDWRAVVEWTGDSSYLVGGESLTLRECGFGPEAVFSHANILYIENLTEQGVFRPTTAKYDGTKVKVFDAVTGKELATEKDISKLKIGLEVVCTSR